MYWLNKELRKRAKIVNQNKYNSEIWIWDDKKSKVRRVTQAEKTLEALK